MFDVAYVVRVLAIAWRCRGNKSYKNILSESVIKGQCWLNDLDINMHMNNSRYLRECDFGRIKLLFETGLWDAIVKKRKQGIKGSNLVVSALQVQFRKSVELGDRFEIRSRINGWDDKAFYIEHTMILEKNQETVFSLVVRQALTPRSVSTQMLLDELPTGRIPSPVLSPAIEIFRQNHQITYSPMKSKI